MFSFAFVFREERKTMFCYREGVRSSSGRGVKDKTDLVGLSGNSGFGREGSWKRNEGKR